MILTSYTVTQRLYLLVSLLDAWHTPSATHKGVVTMNTLYQDVKQSHDKAARWSKLPLIRAIGLGFNIALGSGSAGAATLTLIQCASVSPTPGAEVCVPDDLTGLAQCIPLAGMSPMQICGTLTCNATRAWQTISVVPGASDFTPPPCNVLAQTVTTTTELKCTKTVTKDGLPIFMEMVGPVGPDDQIQVCVRTTSVVSLK